jgi:hypothetical protein
MKEFLVGFCRGTGMFVVVFSTFAAVTWFALVAVAFLREILNALY